MSTSVFTGLTRVDCVAAVPEQMKLTCTRCLFYDLYLSDMFDSFVWFYVLCSVSGEPYLCVTFSLLYISNIHESMEWADSRVCRVCVLLTDGFRILRASVDIVVGHISLR